MPGGSVEAFEVDAALASTARQNLAPYEGVNVTHADATRMELPQADLIYVNAGVLEPPRSWCAPRVNQRTLLSTQVNEFK
jgi:protein-L-isoaspartate(D-aspartate) O-methyltransferase